MPNCEGVVIMSVGNRCRVLTDQNEQVECLIKGNFRLKDCRSTNPIAIGDRVLFVLNGSNEPGLISECLPRRNYIVRRASNLSKESHILAANIDQALLIITVERPYTSLQFIDRFLATAEAYSIPVKLIFNKCDQWTDDEQTKVEEYRAIYEPIGYECHNISALTDESLSEVYDLLRDKISLISGHSGVGKTTLLNRLIPGIEHSTQAISDAHNTGMHTTTYSEMLALPNMPNSYIIDTPGIKGFGTIEMTSADTSHYFPELFAASAECKFNNCTHRSEPKCAVIEAIKEGRIALSRYESYLSILEDEVSGPYRNA